MKKLFLPIILLFLLVSSVAFADFVQPGIGWLVEAPNVLMPSGTTDVCQSDGVTCSTIGAASGATTALDNLASVAINTSLLSDTADTDSLGSTSKEWLNAYIGDAGKLYFGLGQDASIERSAANEMTITATAGVTVESVKIDGGVVTGASSITSTGFTGDLTGNADTVTSFTPASGSLTLSGADALTITTTGETNSTLPLGTKTLVATDVATLSSLTSIGTIGTGTWEATDVGVAHGGTGKSSWTQWLIPYADTTTSFSQIAIGTDGQVLHSGGAGVAPAFETLSIGVANLADGTDGELITWAADGTADTVGVGTADQVLTSNGAGAAPTFQDAAGGGDVGGLYGINVETLSGDKTLTSGTDEIYQYIITDVTNRNITLDTDSATAGDRFIIRNNGASTNNYYFNIKQSSIVLDEVWSGGIKEFIFDGTNWISGENGSGENDDKKYGVSIGWESVGRDYSVGVGSLASAYNDGVAIGYNSKAYNQGVAVGYIAQGYNQGTAVGYYALAIDKKYSSAIGYYSKTKRVGEFALNIGADADQENNRTIGSWAGDTANATPTEIYAGGYSTSRFTINASSVLAFRLIVTARDNVAGHVGMWTVENGVIKRDGSSNTAMATAATVTEVVDESGDWSVAVTADDTNESLKIEVTGDGTNAVQWAARLDGVETHF